MKSLVIFGLALALVGCASSRKEGWDKKDQGFSEVNEKELNIYTAQAREHWKQRHKKEELLKALELYEKAYNAHPEHYPTLVKLTRGYYLLADAHVDNIEEKKKYWEKGTSWGEKALATNNKFEKAVTSGKSPEDVLNLLSPEHKEAVYWTAANLGKWAKSSSIVTTLKYKNRIRTFIQQVEKWDPTYFYHAPDRYWGAYYAIAPNFAGGDMSKSQKHFEQAIKGSPEYLGTYVLYADYWAQKAGDKKKYTSLLEKVLRTDISKTPEAIQPENIIEQQKAKDLYKKKDEIF